ncbi:MAG: AAA family ATPase [Leadbetterella sp.]|nr:AAA family ATPase [Leadbetterella sp.]
MKIKSLNIKNFKSIVDITIDEPNPFTVFVGPNGSGKSNIFEALEFSNYFFENGFDLINNHSKNLPNFEFDEIFSRKNNSDQISVLMEFNNSLSFNIISRINEKVINEAEGIELFFKNRKSFLIDFFQKAFPEEREIHSGFDNLDNKIKLLSKTNLLKNDLLTTSFLFPKFEDKENNRIASFAENRNFSIENIFEIIKLLEESKALKVDEKNYTQFFGLFSRIFINGIVRDKRSYTRFLKSNASNLEKVLSRVISIEDKKEDFFDWLRLFIPEFKEIKFDKDKISGKNNFNIYENQSEHPFSKKLISDGTYNIFTLLTAVYQSDEPQFLCIEEPENGLHPFVIRKMVDFFRQACEDKGHYIWLNTHSQTLVECLTADEVIVVDKAEGETKVTQLKGTNLHGLDMAEYWLSGATGSGTPW